MKQPMNEATSVLRPHPDVTPHYRTQSRTVPVEQPRAKRTYQLNSVANSCYLKRVNRPADRPRDKNDITLESVLQLPADRATKKMRLLNISELMRG
jgi:hypothetical protein